MGMIWPFASAHPFGAKLKATILTCPRNGSAKRLFPAQSLRDERRARPTIIVLGLHRVARWGERTRRYPQSRREDNEIPTSGRSLRRRLSFLPHCQRPRASIHCVRRRAWCVALQTSRNTGAGMSNRSTRRRFLAQGAGLACAALVGRVPALAAAPADDLTASRFASQINRSFTAKSLASGDAPAVMMRLRSVEPLEHPAPGLTPALARERSFILVFDV